MVNEIFQKYARLRNSIQLRRLDYRTTQAGFLFVSNISAMGVNFLSSIITARTLGPKYYGDLKFIQSFWILLELAVTLGFLQSGSRILLREKNKTAINQIIGANLLLVVVLGFAMMIFSMVLASPIDAFFHVNVSHIIILLAPFLFTFPLRESTALILQSINKIFWLAILNAAPPILYVCTLLLANFFYPLTTTMVLFLQLSTLLIVESFVIICLKPNFGSFRFWWSRIYVENKTYGWPIFTGSLVGVASGHLNRLAISYWMNNTAVGFYSLALSLVEPLKILPNSVATSSFREFSGMKQISGKKILITVIASLLSLLLAMIFFGKPLSLIYSEDFKIVGEFARFAAVGAVIHGFGDFFNRFIGAHGKGRSLRNASVFVGVVNLMGLVLVVPLYGAWGALFVVGFAALTYLVCSYYYYHQLTSTL